jgi:ABC-2 type transport system ATP-binding protein
LGLARTLLHDPQVLLLDEPLSGLDPRARIEMRGLLRRLGAMGKTIIVSSHILPELADTCNKIGIIDRGVMTVNATVADVMRQVRERIVLNVAVKGDIAAAARLLEQHETVDSVTVKGGLAVVTLKQAVADYSELATRLVADGHRLTLFREEEFNLENAFMALTRGMGAKA